MATSLNYVNLSTYASSAAGTSHTVNFPSGISDGDVLVCLFCLDSASQTPANTAYPKEWCPATSNTSGTVNAYTGGGMQMHCATKNYVSGETTSVTWTTSSLNAVAVMLAYTPTNYRLGPMVIDPNLSHSANIATSPADANGSEEGIAYTTRNGVRASGWDQYFVVGGLLVQSTSGTFDHYHWNRREHHASNPLTDRRNSFLQATGSKFGLLQAFDTGGIVTGPPEVPSYKWGFDVHASDHTDTGTGFQYLVGMFTTQFPIRQAPAWRGHENFEKSVFG